MTDKNQPDTVDPNRYEAADHRSDTPRFEEVTPNRTPRDDQQDRLRDVIGTVPWHRRIMAMAVMWAEVIWPIIMPGSALLALWLGLATMGLFEPYPGLGLISVLLALGIGGWFGYRAAQRYQQPDETQLLRRLERENGLDHRPFTSLTDDLATADNPVARALWARHLARLRAGMPKQLSVGHARTDHARRDPFGLRYAALMLAIVGVAMAGADTERRLLNALSITNISLDFGQSNVALDAWIAPPDYTSLPPVFLSRAEQTGSGDAADENTLIATTTGSTIFAQITAPNISADRPPTIRIGDEIISFEPADPGQFHLTYTLDLAALQAANPAPSVPDGESATVADERERVTIGFFNGRRALGAWDLLVTPDRPPSMVLSDRPSVSEELLVEIPYAALDDYGLTSVIGTLTLLAEVEGSKKPPVMEEIIGQAPEGQSLGSRLTTTARQDLIAHPWAGLEIAIELTAQDALGQTASSETETLVLPMRSFTNPVARALVDHRQNLTLRPQTGPSEIAAELRDLAATPENYNSDTVVIIGLAALATRLDIDRSPPSIAEAQQLMWELALRLEDGQLGIAQRALERAAGELADALEPDSDATTEEVQELIEAYEEALRDFMETLQQDFMERLARGETLPELPEGMENELFNSEQMQEMLEQLRDLAETGSRDAAREMLSQLEEMMEALENAEIAEPSEEEQKLRELAERIQELTQEQQQLMDDTFRGRPANPMEVLKDRLPEGLLPPSILESLPPELLDPDYEPSEEERAAQRSAERARQNIARSLEQETLRRDLGDIMIDLAEAVDDIPQNLGNAEQAMRGATDALQRNQTARALQDMGEALEELEELQNQVQDEARGMAGGPGSPQLRFGASPSQGRAPGTNDGFDPLGRDMDDNGRGTGSDVEVPSESDLQRARSILEELRRRSGEFNRPEDELDYIDRLLDRF
ncbi:MAG: TIGR02302 family protein [Pseudomonadota bacterium]